MIADKRLILLFSAIALGLSGNLILPRNPNAAIAQDSSPTPVEEPSPSPSPETEASPAPTPTPEPSPSPQPSPSPVEAPPPAPLLQITGTLEDGDAVLSEDGSLYDVHSFQGSGGQTIAITVESADFDTYLVLADSQGNILEQNDDISEENQNSALEIKLPGNGEYQILVNSYNPEDRGSYELIVLPIDDSSSSE